MSTFLLVVYLLGVFGFWVLFTALLGSNPWPIWKIKGTAFLGAILWPFMAISIFVRCYLKNK